MSELDDTARSIPLAALRGPLGQPEGPREKCARDSDWCDGQICRERGIDCPNADPVPVEDVRDRVRTKPIDRYEQVVQLKAAITAQRHRVEVAEAALAREREKNAELRTALELIAYKGDKVETASDGERYIVLTDDRGAEVCASLARAALAPSSGDGD